LRESKQVTLWLPFYHTLAFGAFSG